MVTRGLVSRWISQNWLSNKVHMCKRGVDLACVKGVVDSACVKGVVDSVYLRGGID